MRRMIKLRSLLAIGTVLFIASHSVEAHQSRHHRRSHAHRAEVSTKSAVDIAAQVAIVLHMPPLKGNWQADKEERKALAERFGIPASTYVGSARQNILFNKNALEFLKKFAQGANSDVPPAANDTSTTPPPAKQNGGETSEDPAPTNDSPENPTKETGSNIEPMPIPAAVNTATETPTPTVVPTATPAPTAAPTAAPSVSPAESPEDTADEQNDVAATSPPTAIPHATGKSIWRTVLLIAVGLVLLAVVGFVYLVAVARRRRKKKGSTARKRATPAPELKLKSGVSGTGLPSVPDQTPKLQPVVATAFTVKAIASPGRTQLDDDFVVAKLQESVDASEQTAPDASQVSTVCEDFDDLDAAMRSFVFVRTNSGEMQSELLRPLGQALKEEVRMLKQDAEKGPADTSRIATIYATIETAPEEFRPLLQTLCENEFGQVLPANTPTTSATPILSPDLVPVAADAAAAEPEVRPPGWQQEPNEKISALAGTRPTVLQLMEICDDFSQLDAALQTCSGVMGDSKVVSNDSLLLASRSAQEIFRRMKDRAAVPADVDPELESELMRVLKSTPPAFDSFIRDLGKKETGIAA